MKLRRYKKQFHDRQVLVKWSDYPFIRRYGCSCSRTKVNYWCRESIKRRKSVAKVRYEVRGSGQPGLSELIDRFGGFPEVSRRLDSAL